MVNLTDLYNDQGRYEYYLDHLTPTPPESLIYGVRNHQWEDWTEEENLIDDILEVLGGGIERERCVGTIKAGESVTVNFDAIDISPSFEELARACGYAEHQIRVMGEWRLDDED